MRHIFNHASYLKTLTHTLLCLKPWTILRSMEVELPSNAGVRQSGLVNVCNKPLVVCTTFLRYRHFYQLINEAPAYSRVFLLPTAKKKKVKNFLR